MIEAPTIDGLRLPPEPPRSRVARLDLAECLTEYRRLVGRLEEGTFDATALGPPRAAEWNGWAVHEAPPPEPLRAAYERRRAMVDFARRCGGAGVLGCDMVVDFVRAEASPGLCERLRSNRWEDLVAVFIQSDTEGRSLSPIASMFDPHLRWRYVVPYLTGTMDWYTGRDDAQQYTGPGDRRAKRFIESEAEDFDPEPEELEALALVREGGGTAIADEHLEHLEPYDWHVMDLIVLHEMERTAKALDTSDLEHARFVLADPENENTGWVPILFVGEGTLAFLSEYREL